VLVALARCAVEGFGLEGLTAFAVEGFAGFAREGFAREGFACELTEPREGLGGLVGAGERPTEVLRFTAMDRS
jgi:hypothetical protein